MAVQDYKINYKSDFVLTINGDAGWAVPFCIKFWTGMPSQAYFVGFDGVKYVNCRVGDTPTQLLVMFDDHHLPIGPLRMQIAYHTTIEEFPGSVFDEVTNARDVIVTIDGTDYQVLLDFTGEDAPELEFDLPAYANEAERIQNELQRQQNEADRIAAELQREQATAAAVQGAENVNAQLAGNILTITNRQGVSTSVNTKGERGEQGPVGPEGPQGEQGETGISIVSFTPKSETSTTIIYTVTFSDGHTQEVAIPKGAKGDTGATGPQGPQGDTGVSITGMVETGETETDTLYNITFSNGTTQAVAIPKGEKGDTGEQGPVGPQGPQGPMGDVAVITPEQQAAFTMYSTTGQNTNGPMTQKAVTDALVAGSISYDNSQSGLAATNVQGALDDLAARERYSQEEMDYSSVVTTSGKWINGGVWQSKAQAVVILIPKRLFENADSIKVVGVANTRMMFLKTSNSSIGSNASYCDGTGVMSIGANTRFYDIPSDCNYIYFDYSYGGVSRMPTSIQTIQSISGKIADIDLQVQQNEEDLHAEPVDVSVMVAKTVSGFIINGGVWQSKSSAGVIGFIPAVLFGVGSRIDVTGVANTQIAFLTSDSITAGNTPDFCNGTNITTIGAQTMSFDIPSDCVYIYVVVSYSNVSRLPTKIIAHMKVKGLLGKYTNAKTYTKQELLDSYIYDEGKLYNAVSSIGLTIDDVVKSVGTTPCYIFAIPVKGMAEVSYTVFKTSSGFGSLVTDKDGVVIAQYCNTNLTSGTTAHVFLPDNAAWMYVSVSNSIQGLEYSVTVKGLATSEINSNGSVLSAKVCYLPFKSTLTTNSSTSLNLAAIKFVYEDSKIPFQSGYLFHNYNPDDKKIYFGTKLDNAVEVGELDYYPANCVLGVSPKDGTVIGVFRDDRQPIRVYQNGVNHTVNAKSSDGSNTSPKGWLYNSGCEFVTDGDNEYCIFAEYDGSVSNNQRLYIWKGTYPYTSPSDWETVYYKTTAYNPVTSGSITHWHMIRRDPWSGIIYCTSGDFSGQFFWIYSTDNGETWNELASDSNDNTKPSWVLDGQPLRCINFIFTEDYIYFATDHGSNNTLNRIRRNSNGLIDLSTREVLAELPYGIAVNSLCYIESPNGLFLFTRIDTGFESEYSKDVPILFWSFKDNKLITLLSLKKIENNWGGHRGKCYFNYTNGQETRPAMGFALNTPNIFDLIGAWNGIGTIYYEL